MIILSPRFPAQDPNHPGIIVIFGLGLLGGAICRQLENRAESLLPKKYDFNWQPGEQQKYQARDIFNWLISSARENRAPSGRLVILWSAGNAGFASTQAQVDDELQSYRLVLDMAGQLQASLPDVSVEFHLLSSAGGLFEGCSQVSRDTAPMPCRPYGFLKQQQEQLLLDREPLLAQIYRPSTVYGPIAAGIRRGLVSTLLHNGSLGIVSKIYGHLYTLRDYVYYEDIARFVSNNILTGVEPEQQTCHYLIGGKPTSIFEIRRIVERITRRPLYYKLQYDPDNSGDMCFSPDLMPGNWQATSLGYGCERIHHDWLAKSIARLY